ncbi:glycoside hydrolase family 73 protein [Apilactobacillus micheneri]|uniref:Mannosyl-glycoprotein endo-beta-N-acetylglucosamidase n=1 Tax=Apilactobacillus micheneri TaxID=1899430 RepID=A0A9Q8MUE9_9LACO|nr:glucosaminidase domain-containing protein [Apilactobacillus micheneri]TPR24522.1 mannosyl-glycoprotein endo-beta-N-acetylglucosamidase [Apilactobacillus micheneri]TPR25833.1 mannosyl-glycoprotein endo-beta-N-acetylglucosamidase [Apilactobacillus micheneri]TPR28023.1 mannosyl-glycoprotein endo-beta-N-acetylglucosamidase [Apilactobacillus micheneri]TPR29514.1 mannosyl-glycoprotein endo-beta-N-acetylglucosamidase [Apilactobacillus micheneri]TPR30300.1 mannosyl-glycoprotein endo-beta-N-acetylgl
MKTFKWIFGIIVVLIIGFFGFKGAKAVYNNMEQNQVAKDNQNQIIETQKKEAEAKHKFAVSIAEPSIKVYKQNHQVLPSIVVAQAIQESNWGTSELYKKANNIFGIKGKYKGQSIRYYTDEYVSNDTPTKKGEKVVREGSQKKVSVPATFRKYPSITEAVENHDRVIALNFIKQKNITSYVDQANMLQKNNYATDPTYAKSLIKLIRQYNLEKYDNEAINN